MDENKKILLVDDDYDILEFISYNLSKEGYQVQTAANGKIALESVSQFQPDLIILDVMMPEMDGIELCEVLRKKPELDQTVIAFLTARGEDYSQIAGFDAGADDYINKPIKPRLLLSRVKALLKRSGKTSSGSLSNSKIKTFGDLIIDRSQYHIQIQGKEISIPRKEFELLDFLTSEPGKLFTREQIYLKVWGNQVVVGDRTIDVHIRKLREVIGNDYIQTVKGMGYKFVEIGLNK
jgi:two-component system alkaline phosphatase synthesis response regulator PhoP